MPNFQVLDAYGSVITIESSTIGTANRQVVAANLTLTNTSVSGTVGASIIGQLPAGTAVLGSVMTLQGTNPWRTLGSVSGTVDIGTTSGSVVAFQGGAWTPSVSGTVGASIIGAVPVYGTTSEDSAHSSGDSGHFVLGVRNDAVASFVSADSEYTPFSLDSAGRTLTRPYAPEESRVEGYGSTVNVSITTLVPAAGTGLRNYITDLWFANTGSVATLITFKSQGGASVLGYTIAPSGSGSNLPGLVTPIRTGANETFDFQASTGVSVLYATVKGFKAP